MGTAPSSPPDEDTTPPVLTVPEDRVVEVTSASGDIPVTYTMTAQDGIYGTVILEEDGTTITQDDDRGDITISCEPSSGSEFPVGDTQYSAVLQMQLAMKE